MGAVHLRWSADLIGFCTKEDFGFIYDPGRLDEQLRSSGSLQKMLCSHYSYADAF